MGSRLATAAKSGDRLKTLTELRDLLAERIDKAKYDKDIAPLARRLTQVLSEIDEIEKANMSKVTSLSQMRDKLKVAK